MASRPTKVPAVRLGLAAKKIESPLAKYNSAGQLTCAVCNVVVKSEMVWTAHVNGRQHRDKVAQLKKPADQPRFAVPSAVPAVKRKGDPAETASAPSPSKKGVPADFFDKKSTQPAPPKPIKSILKNAPKISYPPVSLVQTTPHEEESMEVEAPASKESDKVQSEAMAKENTVGSSELPEDFFDDPKLGAKIRQIEYKDPVEEEWEKFQKEIHVEEMASTAIQEEDQEVSTTERQLEEIEDQMMNWDRVLKLEQQRDVVIQKRQAAVGASVADQSDSSSEDEANVDELFQWRSKLF